MSVFAPIQSFADLTTYRWLGITKNSYLGEATNYFIYDVIKIGLLLLVINYVMAITRYYFPTEKVRDLLTKRRWFGFDYLLAAMLGVITPFCSCSSIPLFIGFLSAGIPMGVTFTFLISSPLVNESSLALFPAIFGLRTTILYNLVGVLVSIVGGMLIQKLKMDRYVEPAFLKLKSVGERMEGRESKSVSLRKLVGYWWEEGMRITKSIFPYVVLGVLVGAVIHGFVPEGVVEKFLMIKTWWIVPVATLLGVPFYANSVSVIPVVEAVVGKGVPMGTALAFMTATVTLSIPEALILKRAMRWQLLATFFGITTMGIVIMGYIFNMVGN